MFEDITAGAEIDGFKLVEQLHAGGTALLFRAEVTARADPGVPILLKIPRIGRGQPLESVLGFEMESMILPELHGDRVPKFVAAGELAATPYIAMEHVTGRSLASMMEAPGALPFSIENAAAIGASIADALSEIHRQGVIHHDIKPDNVLVRDDGTAVLIDFGFAHHARLPDLLAEEQRFAAGSAPYVSPEQISGSRSDSRSDVFALGAVIYEMVTGQPPFGIPETAAETATRLWKVPQPPRALNERVTPWLQEIILRCLEPVPAARYQNAAHIAFDLRHPEQVALTPRAERVKPAPVMTQLQLWWRSRGEKPSPTSSAKNSPNTAPVIMVAVDTSHPDDPRHAALQWATSQMASLNMEFRMICVSVVKSAAPANATTLEASASGRQLEHKVRLTHWAEPLRLPAHRLTLHVLESGDPAATLLTFAKKNHADLIVLGAPGPSEAALAWWRSVASTVTANAHCSVHVVRVPERPRPGWHGPSFDQDR